MILHVGSNEFSFICHKSNISKVIKLCHDIIHNRARSKGFCLGLPISCKPLPIIIKRAFLFD